MRARCLAIVMIICLFAVSFIPSNVSASGGDAAKLDKVEVSCDPPQQGLGGEVEVTAKVHVYGGCCYHLYSYNVRPVAEFPEQVTVISGPSPTVIDEIDGLPGGVPTTKDFTWTVKSDVDGDFDIKIRIDTDNCGSVEGECVLKYTKGAKITSPTLFPQNPVVGEDLQINFNAEPTLPGVTLETLTLYYLISQEELEVVEANQTDLVVLENGAEKRLAGTGVEVERDQFDETLYKAKIKKLGKEGNLYFWILALDSKGETSTSAHYQTEVINQDEIYLAKNIVFVVLIVVLIIGVILISFVNRYRINKAVRDKTKLYRLGSQGNTEFMDEDDRKKVESPRWPHLLMVVLIILAVLAIVLIVFSAFNGSFGELITHLREGK